MSYLYVFDEFLQDKKYEKELNKIETRLADLGITGRIFRLALFRNATETIKEEIGRGASTVVAVGNDATVGQVLGAAVAAEATLGLIPLGEPQHCAELLGLPSGAAAADALSARIIETIDVGQANERCFIRQVTAKDFVGEINCDGRYKVAPMRPGTLAVRNLDRNGQGDLTDPRDGRLEMEITAIRPAGWRWWPKRPGPGSSLRFTSAIIAGSEPTTLFVDGVALTGMRFEIKIHPQKLKVITGRKRHF